MTRTIILGAMLALAFPGGPWFGADKVKHFLMSALVQSTTFSIARWAGAGRRDSHIVAATATVSIGVLKELHDRRSGQPFSVSDLAWNTAGAVSAAALLNRTR